MALPRGHAARRRLPRGLGLQQGPPRPRRAAAHQFRAQRRRRAQPLSENPETGYFREPTPGAANGPLRLLETVALSRAPGPFAETFALDLSGAGAGQKIRYVLAAASAAGAAVPEPDAASPEYTGPLTIASSVIVRAAVFSADDSVHGVASTAHYLKLGTEVAGFASSLPVLVLDDHGAGPLEQDGADHPAWLYHYQAAGPGVPVFADAPDLATPLTATVRGSSSALFPKKSYNFKLKDTLGQKRALPLMASAGAYEKWAVVAPWNYDRTYINNAFIYTLSNRLGRWAPRTQFAELFAHTDGEALGTASYAGLAVLTDRIEAGPAVVVAFPKAADLAPAQRDYIQNYVQHMEDALRADQARGWASRTYLDYLDRASWVDHHILNVFAANLDALQRSAYFTKDRGGKLVAGPVWDFDRAFNSADLRGSDPEQWALWGGTEVWNFGWWGILAQDPEFMQDWVDRWQSLRQTELAVGRLTALADSLAASVGAEAAARDAARWPDNAPRYANGYAGEIAALKTWLVRRARWIDQQFLAAPTVADNGTLTFTPPAGAQLAYTLDGSDPRSLGGAVAPNALLTSAPLTVPGDANVHVRSYRASLRGSFPGSPWSSAVAGANASPLSPAAKLINLSSRALIGSGQNALIAGVMVADTENKSYLARAVGPTLGAFGLADALPDPVLGIFRGDGVELYRNNRWQDGPDAARLPALSQSVGAFALVDGSHDAALVAPLPAGAYTMQISSETAQGGVGLAELYTLDTNGRTTNLSTRAMVRAGDGLLVGGFVVQGPAYKRMLVRAVGPALAAFGVEDALADPVLRISSGGKEVATVDDWSSAPQAAVTKAATSVLGAFALPDGSKDAALLITLPPGPYTVEVSGKNGTEGVALLEIYEVP
ncbi:MAG: CotH kinase family protein [Verrucomicrobia bacterium]|nr:CotH kinase family protein [Verrucomicrobiota bacterium]